MGNVLANKPTKESYVCIKNRTKTDIVNTQVWDIDSYDWEDGSSRPDKNLNGIQIPSEDEVRHREEVHLWASNCPFGITFIFSDGSRDAIMIRQKYAIGETNACFEHREKSHNISYHRDANNTLVITIDHTAQQVAEREAERLHSEAKSKAAQNNFAEALRLANEALGQSSNDDLKSQIGATVTDISAMQDSYSNAKRLRRKAIALVEEAADLQSEEEKNQYLRRARVRLDEAQTVFPSDANINLIEVVKLILQVNQSSKEAQQLIDEVEELNTVEDCDVIKKKLRQAIGLYKNVVEELEEGVKIAPMKLRNVLNSYLQTTEAAITSTEEKIKILLCS